MVFCRAGRERGFCHLGQIWAHFLSRDVFLPYGDRQHRLKGGNIKMFEIDFPLKERFRKTSVFMFSSKMTKCFILQNFLINYTFSYLQFHQS